MSTKVEIDSGSSSGRFTKILLSLLVLLIGFSSILWVLNGNLREANKELKIENRDFSRNVYALTEEVTRYKIKLNDTTLYVSKVNDLTLKVEDWKNLYSKEVALVKAMKLKPSQVSQITQASISSKDTVYIPVYKNKENRDSASYRSKWIDITYQKLPESQGEFTYEKRDSISLIQDYKYKYFLFIRLKKKDGEIRAVSHDPKTTILGITNKKIIK